MQRFESYHGVRGGGKAFHYGMHDSTAAYARVSGELRIVKCPSCLRNRRFVNVVTLDRTRSKQNAPS